MKFYLHIFFFATRIQQGINSILNLLLKAAFCEFNSIDCPGSLGKISWKFNISSTDVDIFGEKWQLVGDWVGQYLLIFLLTYHYLPEVI